MAMWWVIGTGRSAPTEAMGKFTEEPSLSSEKLFWSGLLGPPVTGTFQNFGSVGAGILL